MTRLVNDHRTEIVRALIAHRFQADFDAVVADQAALASECYSALYPADVLAKMNKLPSGWLREVEKIDCAFGGMSAYLQFSGTFSVNADDARAIKRPAAVFLRFTDANYRKSYPLSLPVDHALSIRWEHSERAKTELVAAIKSASRSARSALDAVATVEKLISAWPEVAPFAAKFIEKPGDKPKLPAIRVETLNAALGLPVEAL